MVQVKISDGILEGELVEDELATFYSFKGIPYAAPPVGDLRFKPPQPVQPWEGVRSAKEYGSPCIQLFFLTNETRGSEDCLYLNVYTPDLKPKKPLPVMVWIHGGVFLMGNGSDEQYGPEYLVRQDVILVTLNYRLEILGFLCLDSEDVPGNAGMKDQVAALKWVQKNISQFGGDPRNVTIFGQSAGGASVCGHLLSPMSKGLFKRAIAQSGTTLHFWAVPSVPFQSALTVARKLGFYSEDKKELYEFFKSQPAENLLNSVEPRTLYDLGRGCWEMKFAIAIEKDFGQERFLVGDSYELLRKGGQADVDVIVGYAEDEGVLWPRVAADINEIIDKVKMFDDFLMPRPIMMHTSQITHLKVGKRFKEYYFGKKYDISIENIYQLMKYYGMDMFVYGAIQWAKMSSKKKKNKTYLFKFTCKSERNFMTRLMGVQEYLGDKIVATHEDDLHYLFPFKISGVKTDKDSEAFKLIDRFTKLWTNFAKYGNPTPDDSLGVKWDSYDLKKQKYLDIGNQLKLASAPDAEEIKIWEDIFKEFYPNCVA